MVEYKITLNSINKVKEFIAAITPIDCEADMLSEKRKHIVDGKSILGVFSLDLSQPVILKVYTEDADIEDEIYTVLKNLGVLVN